jgi:hypothetical protein
MSVLSEPIIKMNSTRKDRTRTKTIPSNFMAKETEISSKVVEKQLTKRTPFISKGNEIRTSTKVEVKIMKIKSLFFFFFLENDW